MTTDGDDGEQTHSLLSRRSMLITLGVIGGMGATVYLDPAPSASAATGGWTRDQTQNGWPVIGRSGAGKHRLEGSDAITQLRAGAVTTVLLYVARRFHYEVSTLEPGDVHGFAEAGSVKAAMESNYFSGTAIAILPDMYPVGSSGNLFPLEELIVRDILAECEGVVRWGGDDPKMPKQGHFQIDVPPNSAALRRVAARIAGWRELPGRGPGEPLDPLQRGRRAAALTLQRKQAY